MSKFDDIKVIAPNLIYLSGKDETHAPPIDTDTANMLFVEAGGYAAGFTSLSDAERAAVESLLNSEYVTFDTPIHAPAVYAADYFVASPKPKAHHAEAHAEAIAEAAKKDKSIALIVLDLVVYVEELEKRLKKAKI